MSKEYLEALEELSNDIKEAYKKECYRERKANSDGGKSNQRKSIGKSVRDIDTDKSLHNDEDIAHKDVLETWQDLIDVMMKRKVFWENALALEKLFIHAAYIDEAHRKHINPLLDLMIETVEHESEPQTEDCFVTLVEVLGSYCANWELSPDIKDIWKDLGHQVDVNITPQEFRNKAYSVLVSLLWVPKSQNLHWVCQIEDDSVLIADTVVSSVALSKLQQVRRSSPLARKDCVHRVLSRLNEGTNLTLAIACSDDKEYGNSHSGVGMGKTMLAALVASHATVRSKFCVLWLRLDRRDNQNWSENKKSYQWYLRCLDQLCEQLSIKPEWPRPVFEMQPPSVQIRREEEQMFYIKEKMKEILENQAKDILLILDDAWDDQEIEWFRFLENQSILLTTTTQNLSVAWALEVDVLTETEALELFLTEADYPSSHVLKTSLEAKSTVQRCGYHPLTIRTVARWFCLKKMTAGVVKGLEELNSELSACSAKLRHSALYSQRRDDSDCKFLTEVMNLMLSPVLATDGQPTKLMKLCLTSMAVVFDGKVPLEAIHLLWGQLLQTDPAAMYELGDSLTEAQLKKRVRFVSEALHSLGLLSITAGDGQAFVEIHHSLQSDYALSLLKEMEFLGQFTQEETIQSWNESFAEAYLTMKVDTDKNGANDILRKYALERLVSHMLNGQMWSKVVVLLKDERFLRDRLEIMGWEAAAKAHVNDCRRLQHLMRNGENIALSTLAVYRKFGILIKDNVTDCVGNCVDAAKALNCIGLAIAENFFWQEAIARFRDAIKILHKTEDNLEVSQLASAILYSRGSVHLANLEPARAKKYFEQCVVVLDALAKTDDQMTTIRGLAIQKQGDALVMAEDYLGAMEKYKLASERLYENRYKNRVEIGTILLRKGRLHQIMGQFDEAKRTLEDCVHWKLELAESSGDLAIAFSYLGDIYADEKQAAKAAKAYEGAAGLFKALADEVEESDLGLVVGKLHELSGDYESCQECLGEVTQYLQQAPDDGKFRTCYDFRCIGRIYEKHGNDEEARAAYEASLDAVKNRPESLENGTTLYYKAEFLLARSQRKEALELFEESLRIRTAKLGPSDTVLVILKKIANIHRSNGDLNEADIYYQKMLDFTEKVYGEDCQQVAPILYDLAEAKESMKLYAEALGLFSECLDVQKRKIGKTEPVVAETLQKLGFLHARKENYHAAFQCYAEAVDIQQLIFQEDDPRLANSLHMLGSVARKGGDGERALPFLLDAHVIRKSHGYQRQLCDTLQEIGHVHRQLGEPARATHCYEQCIEILTEAFGEMDEKVGDIYLSLGHAKRDSEQTAEAVQCYVKALNIQKQANGGNHRSLAAPLQSLGVVNFQLGNLDEALHCLDQYVVIKEFNMETETMEYVLTLEILGDIHNIKGHKDDASKAWGTALEMFSANELFIAQQPGLGQSLSNRLSSNSEESKRGYFQTLADEVMGGLSEEVENSSGAQHVFKGFEEEDVIQKYIFME